MHSFYWTQSLRVSQKVRFTSTSGLSSPERFWYNWALSLRSTNQDSSMFHHSFPLFMCLCLSLTWLLKESTGFEGSSHIRFGCKPLLFFLRNLPHTWYLMMLNNFTGEQEVAERKGPSCSAQKYAILYLQLSSMLLYLTNSSANSWPYWHMQPSRI